MSVRQNIPSTYSTLACRVCRDWVWGLGFGVLLRFREKMASALSTSALGFRVQGSGFRVQGLGLRV